MNTKINALLAAIALAGVFSAGIDDAGARERTRTRAVSNVEGVRNASTSASASGANGSYARGRNVQSDGQGNASGWRNASVSGANGGSASSQGSFYRNADGSAGRQGSATATSANGGTASTSGGFTKNPDGTYSGGRETSATGANGNSYNGSTAYENGSITHTGTCTNAAGEVIACPGGD
ncbi:hypothetical protein [Pseudoxanthomonas sacheonensis]|uniref:hypothetical protein n=1 Tax=Pseudoxanthomonas sacheonensis TaxID=443615 RepID=UPI0013D75781|nr:hypothetical protein [Pseudoxanthomonas sacheonensis]KAF1710113.1 hypothetical protein CSC73_05375 [Pseudoxanthomonas sacheonensis]